MKLQQATMNAIIAVIELAASDNQKTAAELASTHNISQHHLAKVLRTLAQAGIVSSARGPGGGCVFTANAKRLTLGDVIEIFEPGLASGPPMSGSVFVDEVGRMLAEIDRITLATLRSVTIQTVLNNARRRLAARSG